VCKCVYVYVSVFVRVYEDPTLIVKVFAVGPTKMNCIIVGFDKIRLLVCI